MNTIGDGSYLGCSVDIVAHLKRMNDRLNAKVVEQVEHNQELLMLNNFARESNEYVFKKSLQERISDITSWRWVLNDLSQRLGDAIEALQYEQKALCVVIERIEDELKGRESTRPGILKPMCDSVEEAIIQECDFLIGQKRNFKNLISSLEKHMKTLGKTKANIENDICNKQQTISIEEGCVQIKLDSLPTRAAKKIQKNKESPIDCWEKRCKSLKQTGLQELSNAVIIRQQVREARVHLSIAAQSFAVRVDSAIRRRLHSNKIKLQDLHWQKDETIRDYKTLGEELKATEQNIIETMEQERVIAARLIDRSYRPVEELTADQVDRNLKDEQKRLKSFVKQLRTNHSRITIA